MKNLLVFVALATLTACDSSKSEMKQMVIDQLTDPDSVKFGEYLQINSKKRDWACLEFNAKGPGGGYLGENSAYFVAPAGTDQWEFSGLAGSFEICSSNIKGMQPYEGGPR